MKNIYNCNICKKKINLKFIEMFGKKKRKYKNDKYTLDFKSVLIVILIGIIILLFMI